MITLSADQVSATGLSPARPTITLPAMPCEVHFRGGQKLKPTLIEGAPEPTFRLEAKTEAEFSADPFEAWEIHSRRLIDSFLAVTTPDEALHFLTSSGHFLWNAWSTEHPHYTAELTWMEFRQWQELLRDIIAKGFAIAKRDETAEGGISTFEDIPAPTIDADRKRLILDVPNSTFELLNGCQPYFALEMRPNPSAPDGPPEFALVTETLTTMDTMLARLYIESLLTSLT